MSTLILFNVGTTLSQSSIACPPHNHVIHSISPPRPIVPGRATDLAIKLYMSIGIVPQHLLHLLLLGQFENIVLLDDLVVELGRRLVSGRHGVL